MTENLFNIKTLNECNKIVKERLKNMNPISMKDVIGELERAYDLIADRYQFKAIRPIITIQSKGRAKASGWHWKDKWIKDDVRYSEINICAEHLKDDPISTLVHEMAHYHNAVEGIKDCNSTSQYHNKKFKERAEMYGLNCIKMGRFGYAGTTMGDKLKEAIVGMNINYDIFKLYRTVTEVIKAPTKMKKWSCDCTNIRVAVELDATCNKCKKVFEKEEEEDV